MRLGLFGGTFDPIHIGHLALALEVMEAKALDKVYFCPARISPHKLELEPTDIEHRMQMCGIAIEGCPKFELLDLERDREGPSFTIDTVNILLDQMPDDEWHLILGDDCVPHLHRWERIDELVQKVQLAIGRRAPEPVTFNKEGSELLWDAVKEGLVHTSLFEISASELRKRLRNRMYCAHLLPQKVLDYIYIQQLYYYR